ncbi:MAG: ATP synthase F1 subunit epsilon, partial [Ruminiclostridium sp.]|nr:ATP synthase F1 subunit epsilon [Ruminiclostridium sp.]
MTPFRLKILTPEGVVYDGEVEMLTVRTTVGDKGILARHE